MTSTMTRTTPKRSGPVASQDDELLVIRDTMSPDAHSPTQTPPIKPMRLAIPEIAPRVHPRRARRMRITARVMSRMCAMALPSGVGGRISSVSIVPRRRHWANIVKLQRIRLRGTRGYW